MDDYVGTFSIPRHFMLESLVFYLLDDSNEQALEVNSILSKSMQSYALVTLSCTFRLCDGLAFI